MLKLYKIYAIAMPNFPPANENHSQVG